MLQALLLFTLHESSFSRSYGGILPSSLTRVFPRTLGFSPRLPVSVLVRVHVASLEVFLGSVVRFPSLLPCGIGSLSALSFVWGICLPYSLRRSTRSSIRARKLLAASLSILIRFHAVQECLPVVHRLCFLPRLRSRLTLSRRALLRIP